MSEEQLVLKTSSLPFNNATRTMTPSTTSMSPSTTSMSPSTATTQSPSFPPSPPSSCGSRSPPPMPKSSQEPPQILPPSPPTKNEVHVKPFLPFSIENILRPDFGILDRRPSQPLFGLFSPEVILRTPPKTPETNNEIPVDLSHKKSSITFPSSSLSQVNTRNIPTAITSKPTASSNTATKPPSTTANSKNKYPENPEELANPKVPADEMVWPAWVYCTRYSDRPSSGPRSRRIKRTDRNPEEKRPRTAFTTDQLSRLKVEFESNKYLTEKRRQDLARELGLNESQIKIWFQNKRAKIKKTTPPKSGLAQHLIAQGLYNHSTMAVDEDDPYLN